MRTPTVLIWLPAMLLAAGCMTPIMSVDLHRMEKYRPASDGIVIPEPAPPPVATVTQVAAAADAPAAPVSTPPEGMAETSAAPLVGAAETVSATAPVVSSDDEAAPAPGDAAIKVQGQRILSRGDRVMISLRGIPRVEEMKNVIDGVGEVTLPYIGQVRVAGLTPSEAERLIESTYVERGIYRSINVIVVAEDKVYFVQGEVARQGKFSMSGDVTLLQAITEAGGYTPFANRRSVKIIRGDQVLFYNARDIANGRTPDPMISADDIIVVLRSVF